MAINRIRGNSNCGCRNRRTANSQPKSLPIAEPRFSKAYIVTVVGARKLEQSDDLMARLDGLSTARRQLS